MLIEFRVKNFRSIRDEQALSMVAGQAREHLETHTCRSGIKEPGRLVRSAVIYGPNAAGKTNVLRALQFMQFVVMNSAVMPPTAPTPYDPFKLSAATRSAPSEFQVSFVQEETLYEYGFSTTAERVQEEWLTENPLGRSRRLFARKYDPLKKEYSWNFSAHFRGNRLLWRDSTRPNALFLSTAAQLNSVHLLPVFSWFQRRLVVVLGIGAFNIGLTLQLLVTPEGKDSLLPFVREADPSVADVEMRRENLSAVGPQRLVAGAGAGPGLPFILDQPTPDAPPSAVKINFSHNSIEGDGAVKFDLSEESSGTQALFMTAGAWLNVLKNGEVLIFDEIDTSLHPLLTRFLIKQFHSDKTNPNGAQLICSTHDTTLLSTEYFRRDQIWFVERNNDRATRLFPLSDFSPRNDEALERAYLRGRYGALPILDELALGK